MYIYIITYLSREGIIINQHHTLFPRARPYMANLSTFHQLKGDPCICAIHHQCFAEVGAEHVWKTLGGSHQTPWGLKHSLIKEYNLKRT